MSGETGIFSWYGFFEAFEKRMEHIAAAGFDGVTLWWEDEEGEWPLSRRKQKQAAASCGLKVFNVHMAGLDSDLIWSESNDARLSYLRRVMTTLEEMADDGLHQLVIHLCESEDIPAPGAQLLRSMETLVRAAEENHSVLSVENTWRADYLDAVFQEFNVKQVGFCYDTSHGQLRGHESLLQRWGERLDCCHLSDNDLEEDCHWLPGDGAIDFAPLLIPLLEAEMPYTLEVVADRSRYDDSAVYAVKAFTHLNELLKRGGEYNGGQ